MELSVSYLSLQLILAITGERKIHVWFKFDSRADLAMFQRRLSLCVEILTKLFQQVTHRNQLSVLLGQHDFINFCNLRRLILKTGGYTLVLVNHKKGIFPWKRALLGGSQWLIRGLPITFQVLGWKHTKVFWLTYN